MTTEGGPFVNPKVNDIPFKPFDKTLREHLRKNYFPNMCNWLLGKHTGSVLAEESNSNWESALTIMFLAEVRKIFQENQEERQLCEQIPTICAEVTKHLSSRVNKIQDRYINWDGVTWDTSVVIRAILTSILEYSDKFSEGDKELFFENVKKGMHWLFMRFENWDKEVKYPFGPSDVAQILITAIYLKKNFSEEYKAIQDSYSFKNKEKSIIEQIAEDLLRRKEIVIKEHNDTEEELIWWGDFFQTAEVIDSLIECYDVLDSNIDNEKKLKDEIRDNCKKAIRFFEYKQCEDGMWGTHVDTLRTLYVYVKVPSFISELDPEPHLVFKALRWICDSKQTFDDGSFLHTMFLTIFMCDALIEVYNKWELSKYPIERIYDDVLWSSPMRTTSERTKRFAVEAEKKDIEIKFRDAEKSLSNKSIIIFILSASLITIISLFSLEQLLGNISIIIVDKENAIALASLVGTLFATILTIRLTASIVIKRI